MPKVLRIINRFNLGGPTYNAAYLTRYLQPEYETLLIGGEKDESEGSSLYMVQNLGIEPIVLHEMRRSVNPLNDLKAFLRIRKIIKEFKPDIVHTHASKAGTLGRLAAWIAGVPVIVHTFHGHVFHSYFGNFKTTIYKTIERFLASKSNVIIAISEKQKYELGDVHRICLSSKIRVIPLGFDLQRFQENKEEKRKNFRKRYQLDDDEIAVVIIGRLVPVKNHSLFLEAIAYVKKNTSKKIRAFIVGDGEEREKIESKAMELGIDFTSGLTEPLPKKLLTFTSWLKEIDWVCAGADIITLTSFNEGTPVSLIEAQAANKPIVATRVGGIENVVTAETTLLSEIGETEKFCANLLLLCENDDLRLKMSLSGWDFVKVKFHFTRLTEDMKLLYRELFNNINSSFSANSH